jgi:SNF2 family DNA or RNA helicase
MKSKTHIACMNLKTQQGNNIWCLTGTPIINKYNDLLALCNIIQIQPYTDEKWWRKAIYTEELLSQWKKDMYIYVPKNVISLPDKLYHTYELEMYDQQKHIYNALKSNVRDTLKKYINKNITINYIIVLLTRLRQCCIHPNVINYSINTNDTNNNLICKSIKLDTCNKIITKIINNSNDKIIVFSQFTKILKIYKNNIKYNSLLYSGDITYNNRTDILNQFKTNNDIRILFINLQCGGLGLTINSANHVIFLDPWWNLSVENQATDRVHRIGQTKQVHIHKLFCKQTIEEWIIGLQKYKQYNANKILFDTNNKKISQNDIRQLYNKYIN